MEELKAKGAGVKVMLDPPRYTVAVAANDPVRGVASAPVTIVEFSDYQCPFCARVNPTLDQVRKTYGDKVKIVFKDFPLPNHPQAPKASEAAHCAGEQGKYWEMHDLMFANQRALNVPELKQYATDARPGRREVHAVPGFRQACRPRRRRHGAGREAWASTRRRRSTSTAAR